MFLWGWGLERGLSPPQMMVKKLKNSKMHFKNVDVDHWVHALYMNILNTFYIVNRLYLTS